MINGEVLFNFIVYTMGTCYLNFIFIGFRWHANHAYMGVIKKKGDRLTRSMAFIYGMMVLFVFFVMDYASISCIPDLLDLKCECVEGTILSIDNVSRKYYTDWGTIYLRDSDGKIHRLDHTFYDDYCARGQAVEILLVPRSLGSRMVMKVDGEYTDFYESDYWPPELVKKETQKFLCCYLLASMVFGLGLWLWERKQFRRERKNVCFMQYPRIKISYVIWLIGCVAFKLELILLIMGRYEADIMKIVAPATYTIYKVSYCIYLVSRYYYITIEGGRIRVKNKWNPDQLYEVCDCKIEAGVSQRYVKVCLPSGKKGVIYSKNDEVAKWRS